MFGGKLTTYRRLAEHALQMLEPHLPSLRANPGWTAGAPLPGGDFPIDGYEALVGTLRRAWPFLTDAHARRLARLYGTRATTILSETTCLTDLGQDFGATLTGAEVDYLTQAEWARTAEDVLWRRTKLGLRLSADQVRALERYLATPAPGDAGETRATPVALAR